VSVRRLFAPQVPRLHAFSVRTLPLPSPPLPPRCSSLPAAAAAELAAAAPALRVKVLAALAACLGGDPLAAEYVLLHILR
jgi:hypothetical protein